MNLEKSEDTPLGFILISIFWILLAIWILYFGVQISVYNPYYAIFQFPFILAAVALIFIGWGVLSLKRLGYQISIIISIIFSFFIILFIAFFIGYNIDYNIFISVTLLVLSFFTFSILENYLKNKKIDHEQLIIISISFLIPFSIQYYLYGGLRYIIDNSFSHLISIPIYFLVTYIIIKKYKKSASTISFLISLFIILIIVIFNYKFSFKSYFELSSSNLTFYFYIAFSTIAFYLNKNRDIISETNECIKVKLK